MDCKKTRAHTASILFSNVILLACSDIFSEHWKIYNIILLSATLKASFL